MKTEPEISTASQQFLLGQQGTTNTVHLSTIKQMPRCGGKNNRYRLANFQGVAEQITCKRCRAIADREVVKSAAAALGRKGGKVKSRAKAQAVRQNGKRGGRPVKVFRPDTITADQLGRAFLAASRAGRSFSDLEREVLMHRATTGEAAAAANEILAAMLEACR